MSTIRPRKRKRIEETQESIPVDPLTITPTIIRNTTPSSLATWPIQYFELLSAASLVSLNAQQLRALNGNALSIIAQRLCQSIIPKAHQQLLLLSRVLQVPITGTPSKQTLCNQIRDRIAQQFNVAYNYTQIRGNSLADYENLLDNESEEDLDQVMQDFPSIVDPVNREIIRNPVLLSSGRTYDASSVLNWIRTSNTLSDPLGGNIQRYAIPNRAHRNVIGDVLLKQLGISQVPDNIPYLSETPAQGEGLWSPNKVLDLEEKRIISGPLQLVLPGQTTQVPSQRTIRLFRSLPPIQRENITARDVLLRQAILQNATVMEPESDRRLAREELFRIQHAFDVQETQRRERQLREALQTQQQLPHSPAPVSPLPASPIPQSSTTTTTLPTQQTRQLLNIQTPFQQEVYNAFLQRRAQASPLAPNYNAPIPPVPQMTPQDVLGELMREQLPPLIISTSPQRPATPPYPATSPTLLARPITPPYPATSPRMQSTPSPPPNPASPIIPQFPSLQRRRRRARERQSRR
jgi:hypothetical protein